MARTAMDSYRSPMLSLGCNERENKGIPQRVPASVGNPPSGLIPSFF